jgi:hypothetical protein
MLILAVPALAQAPGPLKPIPKAGEWMLADDLPPAKGCAVMIHTDDLDVNLLETNDGHMVLVASRPDWRFNPGKVNIKLQLDQTPDKPIEADTVANLVVSPVDAGLEAALFAAKEVTWKVPGAQYQVKVGGLKAAFAALKACNIRKGLKN